MVNDLLTTRPKYTKNEKKVNDCVFGAFIVSWEADMETDVVLKT